MNRLRSSPAVVTVGGRGGGNAAGGDGSARLGAVETRGAGSSFGGHPSYMVREAVRTAGRVSG